jgi:hypothetical protein
MKEGGLAAPLNPQADSNGFRVLWDDKRHFVPEALLLAKH